MPDEHKLEKSVLDQADPATNIEKARALRKKFEQRFVEKKRKQERELGELSDFSEEDAEAKHNMKVRAKSSQHKDGNVWNDILEKIRSYKIRDMAGYNNWAMGMISSIHAIIEVAMLVQKDPIRWSKVISRLLPSKRELLKYTIIKYPVAIASTLNEIILNKIDSLYVNDKDLPAIHLCAKLDDQNVLHSYVALSDGKILANDNVPPNPGSILRKDIDTGVVAWAESLGYRLDPTCPNGGIRFLKADNTPLTNDEFIALSHSAQPDENLATFFKRELKLAMEQLDDLANEEDNSPGMTP